jgi:hypothetical protein
MKVSEWKKDIPSINDHLVVFILQQDYLVKGKGLSFTR